MPTIRRGEQEETFDTDEWLCVRFCYVKANQGGGALIMGGTLDEGGIRATQTMLARMRERLERPLDYAMQHGTGAAAKQFFELFAKKLKLPYVKRTDTSEGVYVGSKRVSDDLSTASRLRDVPVFAKAFAKLEHLFDRSEGPTAEVTL